MSEADCIDQWDDFGASEDYDAREKEKAEQTNSPILWVRILFFGELLVGLVIQLG